MLKNGAEEVRIDTIIKQYIYNNRFKGNNNYLNTNSSPCEDGKINKKGRMM